MQNEYVCCGTGPRTTPIAVLAVMELLGYWFSDRRWIVRTGGSLGAEQAFERGCLRVPSSNLVRLIPWALFNGHQEEPLEIKSGAYRFAEQMHPLWGSLNPSVQLLHSRNVHLVLGEDLASPVSAVINWLPEDHPSRESLVLLGVADLYDIPVINLVNEKQIQDAWLPSDIYTMTEGWKNADVFHFLSNR